MSEIAKQMLGIRRSIIADSELGDIEEEYARLLRRKASTDVDGVQGVKGIENCNDFLTAYVPTLIKALRAMAAPPEPAEPAAPLTDAQKLADAIVDCAVRVGITDGKQPLTGPQLLLLLDDVARGYEKGDELDTATLPVEQQARERADVLVDKWRADRRLLDQRYVTTQDIRILKEWIATALDAAATRSIGGEAERIRDAALEEAARIVEERGITVYWQAVEDGHMTPTAAEQRARAILAQTHEWLASADTDSTLCLTAQDKYKLIQRIAAALPAPVTNAEIAEAQRLFELTTPLLAQIELPNKADSDWIKAARRLWPRLIAAATRSIGEAKRIRDDPMSEQRCAECGHERRFFQEALGYCRYSHDGGYSSCGHRCSSCD